MSNFRPEHWAFEQSARGVSRIRRSATLINLLLLLSVNLVISQPQTFAQTSLSTIRGIATDATGGVIPDVKLTLTDSSTNISRTTKSGENGEFEFPELKGGTYRLQAEINGFNTFVADNVVLASHQIRRFDIAMEVGGPSTVVTVRAEAAVIDQEDTKVSAVLPGRIYQDSPMLRVDAFSITYALATLPGVQPPSSGSNMAVAGQNNQVQVGMDGATTEGATNQISNIENVSEITVVTSNNSAEFARAGYFDAVGVRGVNALHGKLYYYHSNSALNAREFFSPDKGKQIFHSFGAHAAGPIVRDRTFYFVGYNAQRDPSSNWQVQSVPTNAMRDGNFSGLLDLASPIVVRDPLTSQAFPNNVIPTSRLNALAQNVQSNYIAAPNQGSPDSFSNNLSYLHPYSNDNYRQEYIEGRIDHKLSEKNEFFGRMSNRWSPYVLPGSWPSMTWTRQRYAAQIVLSDTHVFTPNLVNTARFSWYKNNSEDGGTVKGVTPPHGDEIVNQIGLQGVNPDGLSAQGFPRMSITGYNPLRISPGGIGQHDNYRQYAEALTWVKGRHTMKMGGELKTYASFRGSVPEGTYGSFTFNGSLSGYGYSDFLLGLPIQSSRVNPLTNRDLESWELGMFFTDTWRASSRLTLTYGLRWDRFGAPTYQDGLQYNFDFNSGSIVVPTQEALARISPLYPTNTINVAVGDTIARPTNSNIAPRIGVAYMLTPKTALRGGYGIFTEFLGEFQYANSGGPYQIAETFTNKITNGQALFSFPNPFPAFAGSIPSQSASGYPIDVKNGRIHQYNLTLEHEFRRVGLSASYIGSRANGLNYNLSINQQPLAVDPATGSRPPRPYPNLVSVAQANRDGETRFNSLQLRGHTNIGSVFLDSHWTWAHNMYNYGNLENAYDHHFWNRVNFTPTQRAVASLNWDLPVGRGRHYLSSASRVANGVLGGWKMYWVSVFQTGLYNSPTYSGLNPADGLSYTGSPDRISDGNLPSDQRTMQRWFDTSAFVAPPRDRLGNSGKNIIEGPGLQTHNLSIAKSFPINERLKLEFSLGAVNIFNHPNFSNPTTNVVGPTAGVISSVLGSGNADGAGARRVNARVRINW